MCVRLHAPEMALLTGSPRTASLIATTDCVVCLKLSAERFRRFLPLAPELMDDLIQSVKARRMNSIAADAESCLRIPDIDRDIESKLYLYSLLGNKRDDEEEMEAQTLQMDLSKLEMVSITQKYNILSAQNESKRNRIEELTSIIRKSVKLLEPSAYASEELQSSLPRTRRRSNSWASNTEVEQNRQDTSRIIHSSIYPGHAQQGQNGTRMIGNSRDGNNWSSCSNGGALPSRYVGKELREMINIDIDSTESSRISPSSKLGLQVRISAGSFSAKARCATKAHTAAARLHSSWQIFLAISLSFLPKRRRLPTLFCSSKHSRQRRRFTSSI